MKKIFKWIAVSAAVLVLICSSIIIYHNRKSICSVFLSTNKNKSEELNGRQEKGFAVYSGEWIYFCDPSDNDKIYKIKSDGTGKSKICDDSADSLLLTGRWIFYANKADKNKLYKITLDGSERKNLTSEGASYINLDGGNIYYSNIAQNSRLYCVNVDGRNNRKINDESASFINLYKDYIIYNNGNKKIVRIMRDGTERKVLCEDETSQVTVSDGKVYFGLKSDDYKLYSIDLEGTGRTRISDGRSLGTIVSQDNIFFLNMESKNISLLTGHIYKIRNDSSMKSSTGLADMVPEDITTGVTDNFCLSNNTIFYKSWGESGRIYRMNPNQNNWQALEGRVKVFTPEQALLAIKQNIDYEAADEKLQSALNKAKEIIAAIIKPGMGELDKELAVHDYLVRNVRYDNETYDALKNNQVINLDSHNIYNVILNGKGVCDGFAYTTKLLLGMCGIESDVVVGTAKDQPDQKAGEPTIYHAWNMVKIDGSFYNLDMTWDENLVEGTGMISYKYFNLSDRLMSEDHKWDENLYEKCISDKYDFFAGLIFAARDDDTIYYSDKAKNYRLYKIKPHGTGITQLNNDKSLYAVYDGGWIYYSNYSKGGSLHKLSVDGKTDIELCRDWCINIVVKGEWIEYQNHDSKKSYRIRTDGTGKQGI